MRLSLVAFLVAVSMAGAANAGSRCGGPAAPQQNLSCQPPARSQHALRVVVYFAEPADIAAMCGADHGACKVQDRVGRAVLILPNPCRSSSDFALLYCHELGHAEGWPADHRDGHLIQQTRQYPVGGRQGVEWRQDGPMRSTVNWCAVDPKTGSCVDRGPGPPR